MALKDKTDKKTTKNTHEEIRRVYPELFTELDKGEARIKSLEVLNKELYEATKVGLDLVRTVLYEHPDDEIAQAQKIIIDKALAKYEGKE